MFDIGLRRHSHPRHSYVRVLKCFARTFTSTPLFALELPSAASYSSQHQPPLHSAPHHPPHSPPSSDSTSRSSSSSSSSSDSSWSFCSNAKSHMPSSFSSSTIACCSSHWCALGWVETAFPSVEFQLPRKFFQYIAEVVTLISVHSSHDINNVHRQLH